MRQGFNGALVLAAAIALSGCALGMSEFAQKSSEKPLVKEAVLQDDSLAVKPAALVEEEPAPVVEKSPAAMAAETVIPPTGYPNLNVVPQQPKGKLLSPEEKAKVIAELEGLAKSQAVALTKERAAAAAACDNLSAEQLRKKMLQGAC
ncbi:MAG TPA: hypothetical protein VHA70_08245 [Bauldia sp.]|nr:hypothetical protein [Bauldia sp.]